MRNRLYIVFCFILINLFSKAQTSPSLTGTQGNPKVGATGSLKFSGYLHAQYQIADSAGVANYSGGNFSPNVSNRFSLRRGRIKAVYSSSISEMVVQLDVTERGVSYKDAYLKIKESKFNLLGVQAGAFAQPFGSELSQSSSKRESMERARMSQIIFPGDRDLGAVLIFQPGKSAGFSFLNLQTGYFNGSNHLNNDFDSWKDFVGSLRLTKEGIKNKYSVKLGISYLDGGWKQESKILFDKTGELSPGVIGFIADSSDYVSGRRTERKYMGADAEFSIKWKPGTTTIRGEFISGTQPGFVSSSVSPVSRPSASLSVYEREFSGAYFYFVQDIFKTKFQFNLKYDFFDPNTEISGHEIGLSGSNFTLADIRYETVSLGLAYKHDENIKIGTGYDMVKNEHTFLSGFTQDLNDNILTIRIQYAFK
jgi:hypothetical protein